MKNQEFNQSIDFKKILKSRNEGKIGEYDLNVNKLTNYALNKEILINKTFHNISNNNEILMTEFMNSRLKADQKTHKKTMSSNFMKTIKFSPKKTLNTKEVVAQNKPINNSNYLLKNTKCVLKNNKSLQNIIRKVGARSNNVSPINTSFTNKQKMTHQNLLKISFINKNDVKEAEKDGKSNYLD